MKSFIHNSSASPTALPGARAFTLTEVLVASSVFLLAIGAVLLGNSFGMRMLAITQPKLAAGDQVRRTMNQLISDIRSAKFVRVGNGGLTSFTNVAVPNPKQGNAIELYATADTNVFVRFFRDAADQKLKRIISGTSNATTVASAISNNIVFRAEDHTGLVLTNDQHNLVIGITLQYYELASTNTPVGAGNYYKSFALETRIAHRGR
ncbi:MAG TPA: hypothetical protein VJW76_10585 [Verrucomicrobiae bacterium]|nr:hypothetical protein [Verrucomicrobiae bacterium]